MPSFEELYSPHRFRNRVAAKTVVGVLNTGIDVTNLFLDVEDQFKPVDLDSDVFQPTIRRLANTVADVTNEDRGKQALDIMTSMTRAPQSSLVDMGEDSAVFLLGFLGGRKLIQSGIGLTAKAVGSARVAGASGIAKYGVDLAAGAGSAFILEDPEADRLVNFIPEKYRPAFLDYLAYDPDEDESRIEGRFKNALVDMGLGVLADGAFGLVAKTFKHARRSIHLEAAGDPELATKLAKEILGTDGIRKVPKGAPEVDLSSASYAKAAKDAKEYLGVDDTAGFTKEAGSGLKDTAEQVAPRTVDEEVGELVSKKLVASGSPVPTDVPIGQAGIGGDIYRYSEELSSHQELLTEGLRNAGIKLQFGKYYESDVRAHKSAWFGTTLDEGTRVILNGTLEGKDLNSVLAHELIHVAFKRLSPDDLLDVDDMIKSYIQGDAEISAKIAKQWGMDATNPERLRGIREEALAETNAWRATNDKQWLKRLSEDSPEAFRKVTQWLSDTLRQIKDIFTASGTKPPEGMLRLAEELEKLALWKPSSTGLKPDPVGDILEKAFATMDSRKTFGSPIGPAKEAEVIETILKDGPDASKGEDMADVYFRAINHTHMDFANEVAVEKTTNAILKAIYKDLDTRGVQSWDEVYEASETLAKEGHLDSFERMAKLTDDTVASLRRATPATMLIRRMFTESAEEFHQAQTRYYMMKAGKAKTELARELRDRLGTHIMLTANLSRVGTEWGRGLSSLRARVGGDLGAFDTPVKKMVKEKVAAEAAEAAEAAGKPKKPRKPTDVVKEAQTQVEKLTKELAKLRKRFGDDSKLKGPKPKKPDTPEVKDLKERIAFYKGAEADAKRVTKLEGKLEALKALAARGTKLDLEAGTGKLKTPPKPKTPEIVALEKEIASVVADMNKKLKALEPAPTMAERVQKALQAEDPERALFHAVKEAEDGQLEELMKVLQGFNAADARQWLASKGEAAPKTLRILEGLRNIRMMNILSGIPTFVTNTVGGITTTLFRRGVEDVIASLVPSAGKDRMRFMGEVRALRSTLQQPMELFSAGFKGLAEARKSGKSNSDIFAGLAVDDVSRLRDEGMNMDLLIRSDATGAKWINTYGKVAHALSYGHMTVGDQFIKQSGFGGEATSIAFSKGVLKGLKGEALDKYVKTMTEQSIFLGRKGKEGAKYMLDSLQRDQGLSLEDAWKHLKEVSEMVQDGRTYAKDGVFQGDISSKTLKGLETWLNQQNAGSHLLKTMVFPFYRTPVKIMEFSLERTPFLQAISRKWRADFLGHNGTRAKQRAIAKFVSGSMMYSGAFALANSNMITGKHRPEERDALLANKIPEYSIRVPHTDKWISFLRADPFAMFLGISADMNKLVQEGKLDAGTAMAATMNALSSNVLNKTFMKGLSDSLKAANSPAEFGAYYTESQVRSIVSPLSAFQRSFEKVWNANSEEYRKQKPDPAMGELRGWVDIMLGDTGLTGTREYDMTDALGNKIERGSLLSELTGFRTAESSSSPAMRELALHKRMPKNRELSLATKFKMTQEEFLEFKKILGEDVKLRDRLDRIVRSPKYRGASNGEQVKLLDKVIRDSRKIAKGLMLRRDPSLRSKVVAHKRARLLGNLQSTEASLGIPTLDRILETRRETGDREDIL